MLTRGQARIAEGLRAQPHPAQLPHTSAPLALAPPVRRRRPRRRRLTLRRPARRRPAPSPDPQPVAEESLTLQLWRRQSRSLSPASSSGASPSSASSTGLATPSLAPLPTPRPTSPVSSSGSFHTANSEWSARFDPGSASSSSDSDDVYGSLDSGDELGSANSILSGSRSPTPSDESLNINIAQRARPRFLYVPHPEKDSITDWYNSGLERIEKSGKLLPELRRRGVGRLQEHVYDDAFVRGLRDNVGSQLADYTKGTRTRPGKPALHQGAVMMQHLRYSFQREVRFEKWSWLNAQLKSLLCPPPQEGLDPEADSETEDDEGEDEEHRADRRRQKAIFKQTVYSQYRDGKYNARRELRLVDDMFTGPPTPWVIFLGWANSFGFGRKYHLPDIMASVQALQELKGVTFRCFPPLTEMLQEQQKLGDIRALDQIAFESTEQKFSYRPRTCFEHGRRQHRNDPCPLGSQCPLPFQNFLMMKRTDSHSSNHVWEIGEESQVGRLCAKCPRQYRWFGQEVIPSLPIFGEFRVFIVAKPLNGALRSRRGIILKAIRTDETMNPMNIGPDDFKPVDPESQDADSLDAIPLTRGLLLEFALYVYERLRERPDWKEKFESLEVGVRLDIGIGICDEDLEGEEDLPVGQERQGRKRFFVNEITRMYTGSWFSRQTHWPPYSELCSEYARAIHEYFD